VPRFVPRLSPVFVLQFVEKAVKAVSEKVLENYSKWADYLHVAQEHIK